MSRTHHLFQTMKRSVAAGLMALVLLSAVHAQVKIGAGTVSKEGSAGGPADPMSGRVTFSITQGTPAVSPGVAFPGLNATVRFRVSLSWPSNAPVTVRSQEYEFAADGDSTITFVNAPGFAVEIAADGHTASFSRTGATNPTSFEVMVTVSHVQDGTHHVGLGGAVILGDDSAAVSGALTPLEVSEMPAGVMSAPLLEPGIPELSPQDLAKVATLLQGARLLKFFGWSKVIWLPKPVAIGPGVVIAAGAYAIVDGLVYYRTGQSVGPFTLMGRVAGQRLFPIQSELRPNLQELRDAGIALGNLSVPEIVQIAQERAKRTGKS